jgi:hypothetical protein
MKLKLDADGHVIVRDGKPVYEHISDGKEVVVDAKQLFTKITELNHEAKTHRTAAEAAQAKLALYGETDPAELETFLDEVEALGGMEAIRKGAKVNVEDVKKQITAAYDAKLAEKDKVIGEKDGHIYKLEVSNRFKSSQFVADRLTLPADIAEATFGKSFKIEDGRVVAYNGKDPIYSREKPGELAEFDEALSVLVDGYSMKDRILKGTGASGGGGGGGQRDPNASAIVNRSQFTSAKEKSAFIATNGLEAFKALPDK